MALSQPKGEAHALAKKRMMDAALAKQRAGFASPMQVKSPASVGSPSKGHTFRPFVSPESFIQISLIHGFSSPLLMYHAPCRELAESQSCMLFSDNTCTCRKA